MTSVQPRLAERGAKALEREGLVRGVVRVGEVHRPTDARCASRAARGLLGARAQIEEEQREEVDERMGPPEDARRLEAPVREVRLQRLDQAAFALRLEVAIDRVGPADRLVFAERSRASG